jgi:site-specific DNA-cytosine methylase
VVLEQVCLDLEGEGYEVQPFVIPAVAVNAPHRRDRVWIVAHRTSARTGSNDKGIWQEPIGNGGGQGADASNAGQPHGTRSSEGVETNKAERSARIVSSERSSSWNENWLEVATRFCGVFNGLSEELDEIMSDGLSLKYAKTFNKITRQDLPHLWELFQSEKVQWSVGRFNTIQNKDYLFTVLWKLAFESEKRVGVSFESAEVQRAYLRNVWQEKGLGRSSSRSEYKKQYAEEHKDALSSLSHEVALATAEIQKSFLKDRNARLKGLGNAWVPQVAIEILRAIKEIAPQEIQRSKIIQ